MMNLTESYLNFLQVNIQFLQKNKNQLMGYKTKWKYNLTKTMIVININLKIFYKSKKMEIYGNLEIEVFMIFIDLCVYYILLIN